MELQRSESSAGSRVSPSQQRRREASRLRDVFAPVPKQVRSKPIRKCRPLKLRAHHQLSEMDVRRIHFMRHGTEEASENVCMSYRQIGKAMNMYAGTCYFALRRYEKNGLKLVNGRKLNLQSAWERQTKLKGAVKDYLLSQKVLQEWIGMSLDWRCRELLSMGVSIGRNALSAFYKRNRVTYVVVGYKY